VKLGTVRSRIHRGRAALRAALEQGRAAHAVPGSVGERRAAGTSGGTVLEALGG